MAKKKPVSYLNARKKETGTGKGRVLALSGAFAAAVAGGGIYAYEYKTTNDIEATVQKIERVYDVSCHTRQTVMREEFTTPATPQAAEKKEVKDVATNANAQACQRTLVATIIHTDAGDYYNTPALFRGKTQAAADNLTAKFAVNTKYTFKVFGADGHIPGTGISFHKNIVSAEVKPEYVAPVVPQDIQITPMPQPQLDPVNPYGDEFGDLYGRGNRYNPGPLGPF